MTIKKIIYCISLILLVGIQKLIAQESIVSGKVVDTKQLALKSASVQLFDSTGTRVATTITDSLGNFSINKTIYNGSFLVVSFIQYGSRTIFISTINKIIVPTSIVFSVVVIKTVLDPY